MTKAIVETVGAFQLTGTMFNREDAVPFDRPAVVVRTGFIDAKIGADVDGRLKLYCNVADEATDADWLEHLTECGWGTDENFDMDFAIESYPHAQDLEDKPAPAPKKKKAGDPLDHDNDGRKGGSKAGSDTSTSTPPAGDQGD